MKNRTSPSTGDIGVFRRLTRFTATLLRTRRPRLAWHLVFHQQNERWSMIQFRDGADQFYHSKHRVTCSRCRIHHTTQRIWPKFNADLNNGYQLVEARQQASVYCAGK